MSDLDQTVTALLRVSQFCKHIDSVYIVVCKWNLVLCLVLVPEISNCYCMYDL